MAKGRKLTISRSERFLGSYGYSGNTHHTEAEDDGVELGEHDVWSLVDDMVNGGTDHHSINGEWDSRAATMTRRRGVVPPVGTSGGLSVACDDQSGKMMVASPRIVHQFRNGSGDNLASPRGRHMATSAPVNVPDWSKIYRVDSVESIHDSDDGMDDHDDSDMVPPHEYLARSHRSAAKSVFEGVGRTLKGRDMSRVRDAVWSQTGFDGLESWYFQILVLIAGLLENPELALDALSVCMGVNALCFMISVMQLPGVAVGLRMASLCEHRMLYIMLLAFLLDCFYFNFGLKGIWWGMIGATGMQTAIFAMVDSSHRLE